MEVLLDAAAFFGVPLFEDPPFGVPVLDVVVLVALPGFTAFGVGGFNGGGFCCAGRALLTLGEVVFGAVLVCPLLPFFPPRVPPRLPCLALLSLSLSLLSFLPPSPSGVLLFFNLPALRAPLLGVAARRGVALDGGFAESHLPASLSESSDVLPPSASSSSRLGTTRDWSIGCLWGKINSA